MEEMKIFSNIAGKKIRNKNWPDHCYYEPHYLQPDGTMFGTYNNGHYSWETFASFLAKDGSSPWVFYKETRVEEKARLTEVITGAAIKHDSAKAPLSMIPLEALAPEAKVFKFGADKYGKSNYKSGMAYSRLLDATLRHVNAFAAGQDLDEESGLSHLAHARCNLAMLLFYIENKKGTDDRG